MRLNTRLQQLETSSPGVEATADIKELLVQVLAMRDAMFLPWRGSGGYIVEVRSMQQRYQQGIQGISVKADGKQDWKLAHFARQKLVASEWATAIYSSGQITSLLLTPQGEADARALVGDRLRDLKVYPIIEALFQRASGRERGGRTWILETDLFGIEQSEDPSDYANYTEALLPLLTSGAVDATADSWYRVYYAWNGLGFTPEAIASQYEAEPRLDDLYVRTFNSERRRLAQLEAEDGGIYIPMSCT